jgi:hypothetical protein
MGIERVNIQPGFEFLYTSVFDIESPIDLGFTQYGLRRILPISRGRFEGDKLSGEVVPGGAADWQILRNDGVLEVEARYTFKTHDGALIYVRNEGILRAPAEVLGELAMGGCPSPDRYYFRTHPRYETSHASYKWLTQLIAVAVAEVRKNQVIITAYSVT